MQYNIYAFSMLSLGHMLISELVVTDLFMNSLPGMIVLLLGHDLFHTKGVLHEILHT